MTLTDILIEIEKEQSPYFKNYLDYAKIIKKEAEGLLGKVKVFVFGSMIRTGEVKKDIDILVISQKLKTTNKKSEVRAKILKKIGIYSPFEIHLITPEEYNSWYKYFIKKKQQI